MVSGSAALPVPTLERWEGITGQRLLERYGMTEIGMGLSNPLRGERRPGHVGSRFPGWKSAWWTKTERPVGDGKAGQIQVRGPGVFGEYWRRPEETEAAFTEDGWFRTGDRAVVDRGSYRILGRESARHPQDRRREGLGPGDRGHPPQPPLGFRRARWWACPTRSGATGCAPPWCGLEGERAHAEEMRSFAKERLAPYKVPKEILVLDDLPRNAHGQGDQARGEGAVHAVTSPRPPHLSPDQLVELHTVLEKDLRRLERSMRLTDQVLKPAELDQTAVGRLSRMDTLQGQALARGLQDREQIRLAQLQDALRRVAAGTYGWCVACSGPIPFARLLVVPESPECGGCPRG